MEIDTVIKLSEHEINAVSGGAVCECRRQLSDAENAAFARRGGLDAAIRAGRLWMREVATKSECSEQCCNVTGGVGFNYGPSRDNLC